MKQPTSKQANTKKQTSFVGETIAELKKVTWPTRQETVKLTTMVLIVSILAGVFLGFTDYGFSFLIDNLFVPD